MHESEHARTRRWKTAAAVAPHIQKWKIGDFTVIRVPVFNTIVIAAYAVNDDEMLADEALLPAGRLRELLINMRAEWPSLDRRIDAFDLDFAQFARTDDGRDA